MNFILRCTEELYAAALTDLRRPHPFAYERVGFFSTASVDAHENRLVLLTGYHPVPDGHYLRSRKVGAMLGPEAIRTALGRALAERTGQLHVHLHEHDGEPIPSPTDSRELPPLAQSLGRAAPDQTSGYAILSNDAAWAELYPPPSHKPVVASRWTVIGFPLRFLR